MGIDTELNGANGANSEHADPDARSAQQSSAVTRKVTVKLTDQLFKRLEAATDRPGVGKSMVMEAALERFLDPAPPIEGLIHEALARITSQLERLADDVRTIAETVDRSGLWAAQTPQVFRRDLAIQAYATQRKAAATDDAALVESLGHKVHLVEGSPLNIKITSRDDLKLAEQILKSQAPTKPQGGFHPFADDNLWR